MSRELFGTDGVRGLAGKYPLDNSGVKAIGRALGTYFGEPGSKIYLGWDPRESSESIVSNLTNALVSVGINVVKLGVIPTPAVSYLTSQNSEIVAGIMVTASHNPVEYNGIKAFDKNGDKLSDDIEAQINRLIIDGVEDRSPKGKDSEDKQDDRYKQFLTSSTHSVFDGLKIGIDSANGAASYIASEVLEELKADVIAIHDTPNGKNINLECGATDTRSLQKLVVDKKLDLGIALDGDADRIVMVDEKGREVKGDYIMYILAKYLGYKGVVATIMSNLGFENTLKANGISVKRCSVGDRYVLEALAVTGYQLGGEQSGHIILYEKLRTGDALLAAVTTISAILKSGKKLSELCDEVDIYPQTIINISLSNKKLIDHPKIVNFIASKEHELGGNGRLLVRASGTEPLVRIMVESDDAEAKCSKIADELTKLLEDIK